MVSSRAEKYLFSLRCMLRSAKGRAGAAPLALGPARARDTHRDPAQALGIRGRAVVGLARSGRAGYQLHLAHYEDVAQRVRTVAGLHAGLVTLLQGRNGEQVGRQQQRACCRRCRPAARSACSTCSSTRASSPEPRKPARRAASRTWFTSPLPPMHAASGQCWAQLPGTCN